MHNKHRANSNRGNRSIHELYNFKILFFLTFFEAICIYKNKKLCFLDGHKCAYKGNAHEELKLTKRVIACYCWKEDGHLSQSLFDV